MMPIFSFYEQLDPDKMVQKAYFVIPETEKEKDEVKEEGKVEGNQVAEKKEEKKKKPYILHVDFNPSSITMSTTKGSEVLGTQPPAPSLPAGRDPDRSKLYGTRSKRYDQTVKVSMTLIFDTLSKWEAVLSGKNDDNADPEDIMSGRIGDTIVGKFYKLGQGAASTAKSAAGALSGAWSKGTGFIGTTWELTKTVAIDGVWGTAKKAGGAIADKAKGRLNDAENGINKLTGQAWFSGGKGETYMQKLAKCNMFSEGSTYQRLENAYLNQGIVEFVWGPMRFNGKLTNFSTEFSYFSRAGSPLRAKTSIEIELFRKVDTKKKVLTIDSYVNDYKENAWIDQMFEKYKSKWGV